MERRYDARVHWMMRGPHLKPLLPPLGNLNNVLKGENNSKINILRSRGEQPSQERNVNAKILAENLLQKIHKYTYKYTVHTILYSSINVSERSTGVY